MKREITRGSVVAWMCALMMASTQLGGCVVISEGWDDDWGCCEDDGSCDDKKPGSRPNRPDQGGEQPGGEQPGGKQPGGEEPGSEQPGGEDPDDCPVADPTAVCGEDGKTYETPCAASRARVRPVHRGECGAACAVDEDCAIGSVCGTHGRCQQIDCPAEDAPVCGVDGESYGNACQARINHVEVAHAGECPPQCQADTDCELGSICEANRCEVANCPPVASNDFSKEVCASDGFTWASACFARAAHLEIVHAGCCVEE